jgi:SAM-dependent methyltransferase
MTAPNQPQRPGASTPPSWAEYYQNSARLPEVHRHLTNIMPFIAQCRAFAPGPRLLEVGIGTGVQAAYLSQADYAVTGIDLDAAVVQRATALARSFGAPARFLTADMFRLPFPDQAFDLCYHQGLLEHFDPGAIHAALREQLRVAARVLFSVPTVQWRGGLFGDERLWSGRAWRDLLAPYRVVHTFGLSHRGLVARAVSYTGRHLTGERPRPLFRALALARAGQAGFVVERR